MIYFASDIHLGFFDRKRDKEIENLFINWLDIIKADCKILVLLGDVFDYWFEYKNVIPKYFYRTLAKLYELSNSGIKIEYFMGNHDFGHKTFFLDELGIEIIKTDMSREYFGKKFYISHGDGKADKDFWYLILRKLLRNKTSQYLYSLLHPNVGIGFALWCSRKSRRFTEHKNYGEKDGLFEFAKLKIKNEGYDFVIMGHRHKVEQIRLEFGEYINLGCWFDHPQWGKFDGEKFELYE